MIFVILALLTAPYAAEENVAKVKLWCKEMRVKYSIEPGRSFGNLPVELHNKYLNAKCFRFFCKPHPKAGTFAVVVPLYIRKSCSRLLK